MSVVLVVVVVVSRAVRKFMVLSEYLSEEGTSEVETAGQKTRQ